MNILDILFPKRCVGCGVFGQYICIKCAASIRVIDDRNMICPVCGKLAIAGATHPRCQSRYGLDGLTSFFRYHGVIRQMVKALKYRYVSDLVGEWFDLISLLSYQPVKDLLQAYSSNFVLVPVPLHSARRRYRGFNQAELLGKLMVTKLLISLQTGILTRGRQTLPQVEMKDRQERLKNMGGVFSALSNTRQYPHIFLFDDVFTTGATLRSATNTLKRAGAKVVWGITMAR